MKSNITIFLDCFGLFSDPGLTKFFDLTFSKHDAARIKDQYCIPGDAGKFTYTEVIHKVAEDLHRPYEEVLALILSQYKIHEDMFDLARELRKHHHVYLLSNCMKEQMEIIFKGHPFDECFDGQIKSCDIHIQKPDKEIYEYALKVIPTSTRVLFFDDTEKNIIAARENGIEGYVFKNVTQARAILKDLGLL